MSNLELLKKSALFWDINTSSLSVDEHQQFIIERIIEKGNLSQVKILFKMFTKLQIKEVIFTSRNITNTAKLFWQKVLAAYE